MLDKILYVVGRSYMHERLININQIEVERSCRDLVRGSRKIIVVYAMNHKYIHINCVDKLQGFLLLPQVICTDNERCVLKGFKNADVSN
jgi:hypothetical protein